MSKQSTTTWKHQDSDPKAALATALGARDFLRSAEGKPLTATDRVRIVRTLAVATEYAIENARVVGVPPAEAPDGITRLSGEVRGDLFATRAHCYAASTLARTWMLFVEPGRYTIYSATTRDGAPAQLSTGGDPSGRSEAGLPPLLLAAVIIAAIAACSAAICYVGQASAEVIDRKLTQDAVTRRMLATQAQAIAMVDEHSERERAAGHPIPWSLEETRLLDALLGVQKEIALRTNGALPSPFAGAVEKMGEASNKAASTFAGLGVIAAVAGGVYLLTR